MATAAAATGSASTQLNDSTGIHRYKLAPPLFDGDYSKYEDWKHKFIAYMAYERAETIGNLTFQQLNIISVPFAWWWRSAQNGNEVSQNAASQPIPLHEYKPTPQHTEKNCLWRHFLTPQKCRKMPQTSRFHYSKPPYREVENEVQTHAAAHRKKVPKVTFWRPKRKRIKASAATPKVSQNAATSRFHYSKPPYREVDNEVQTHAAAHRKQVPKVTFWRPKRKRSKASAATPKVSQNAATSRFHYSKPPYREVDNEVQTHAATHRKKVPKVTFWRPKRKRSKASAATPKVSQNAATSRFHYSKPPYREVDNEVQTHAAAHRKKVPKVTFWRPKRKRSKASAATPKVSQNAATSRFHYSKPPYREVDNEVQTHAAAHRKKVPKVTFWRPKRKRSKASAATPKVSQNAATSRLHYSKPPLDAKMPQMHFIKIPSLARSPMDTQGSVDFEYRKRSAGRCQKTRGSVWKEVRKEEFASKWKIKRKDIQQVPF